MPDLREKIDRFTAAVLEDAAGERGRIVDGLARRRKESLEEARDAALLESYQYIQREVARIRREAGQAASRQLLADRRALAARREALARELLAQAEERIAAYTRTPAYAARLRALLGEALERLPGAADVQVSLRPADAPLIPALERAAGRPIRIGADGPFRLGGLTARSAALGLRIDASFDCAAGALAGRLAGALGQPAGLWEKE